MKKLIFTIILAAALWTVMFSPLTAPHVDFWLMMTCSALALGGLSTWFNPGWWKRTQWSSVNILYGIILAAVLWGIFWTGDKVSGLLFDFARPQVDTIYGIREGISPWLLSALLVFLIGPSDQIFWRGYVQQTLSGKMGADGGFAVATLLYALVHVPSCNFMLVMAALVAGTVWAEFKCSLRVRFSQINFSNPFGFAP